MFHYELAPGELRQLRLHRALPRAAGQRQERHLDYFDTPDGALARKGLLLARVRCGWEWRLELSGRPGGPQGSGAGGLGWRAELLGAEYCGPSGFDFAFLSEKALRQWLTGLVARLEPVCSEHIREERLLVDTAAGAAGLLLERVELVAGELRLSFGRVGLLPLEGSGDNVLMLARSLLGAFALQPCLLGPVDRARQLGHRPAAAKARPSLPAGQDGGAAFQHIARNCMVHLCLNLPGLQTVDEPEFVHQARVAIRRLRSALKLFAPWLPAEFVAEFSERWRDLANALGDCRNLDVFLAETLPLMRRELGDDGLVDKLQAQAEKRQRQARKHARDILAAPVARLLLLDFEWALIHLQFAEAMPPLVKLARRRLVGRARQVTRLGEAVRNLDPEARHELRIAFKKLRYALEFFAGLFGERRSARYLAGLVDLQEVLGHLNDLATASSLVPELIPPTGARLPQAWLAGRVGALVDALPTAIGHFLQAEPPWE